MSKQQAFRRWGVRLLGIAWAAGALIMLLPVYHGEFIAPGSPVTLQGFEVLAVALLLGFTSPSVLVTATFPSLLFIFSPLTLLRSVASANVLLAMWGGLLMLGAVSLSMGVMLIPMHGVNERLFGMYLLPLPVAIAGLALCVLSHAAVLRWREGRSVTERRCVVCGYDLRATPSGDCPECGRSNRFEPPFR